MYPHVLRTTDATTLSCRRKASAMADLSASHSAVLPTTSVKTKVTVPEGASTIPTASHNPPTSTHVQPNCCCVPGQPPTKVRLADPQLLGHSRDRPPRRLAPTHRVTLELRREPTASLSHHQLPSRPQPVSRVRSTGGCPVNPGGCRDISTVRGGSRQTGPRRHRPMMRADRWPSRVPKVPLGRASRWTVERFERRAAELVTEVRLC